MPLFMPSECYLVTFRLDDEDGYDELNDELEEWSLNLFDEGPEMALWPKAPMARICKRREYVSDRKAWVFTDMDLHDPGAWFFREYRYPSVRMESCCMGTSMIATDREDALQALGETYL